MNEVFLAVIAGGVVTLTGKIIFDWLKSGKNGDHRRRDDQLMDNFIQTLTENTTILKDIKTILEKNSDIKILVEQIHKKVHE